MMWALDAILLAKVELPDFGVVIQQALSEQKRLDMFDIKCQGCGGLGVVADLGNRSFVGGETFYGGKRCPECDGLGSPRG